MTEKRFNMEYVHGSPTIWHITDCGEHIVDVKICDLLNELNDENEKLKQFQEKVAEVIESKMEDNVCNDYKMEVLKEIWNELKLDEVWFE